MTDLADFLRARYAERREQVQGHDGGYNDADGCWGLHEDPAAVLADLDAKAALVDDLLAERHLVVDGDCWYTCVAATKERDGGKNCDDDRRGGPCDCGRDERVDRHLRLLASPFAQHPEYLEDWRP